MISSLFNQDIFKVLSFLSLSPGSKFYRKEIKEKTKMNNVNLDNALNALIKSGVIKKEKRAFFLDMEKSKEIIDIISKEYKKLNSIPLNAYFSIVELSEILDKIRNIDVYLFGSYAKLVFRDDSDIDIALIGNISVEVKKVLSKLIQKIEKRYGKNIEIHYFEKDFYKNKKDPLVRDILKNGIKLG